MAGSGASESPVPRRESVHASLPFEANQRAKYYRLTAAGRKQLIVEHSRWNRIVDVIARVMKGKALGRDKA